jgi:hypothetical protein
MSVTAQKTSKKAASAKSRSRSQKASAQNIVLFQGELGANSHLA